MKMLPKLKVNLPEIDSSQKLKKKQLSLFGKLIKIEIMWEM